MCESPRTHELCKPHSTSTQLSTLAHSRCVLQSHVAQAANPDYTNTVTRLHIARQGRERGDTCGIAWEDADDGGQHEDEGIA